MTNDNVKNLIEQMLNQSGWTVTNQSDEDGDAIAVANQKKTGE